MQRDMTMYDSVTNQRARVRSMPLNEELGQISYMFCDKTVSNSYVYLSIHVYIVDCLIDGL